MRVSDTVAVPRWVVWVAGIGVLAIVLSLGDAGGESAAHADTVTATCENDASTDADTLTKAIASSDAGDTVMIRGHCLLDDTIELLGNRTYTGEHRTDALNAPNAGSVLQQAPGTGFAALLASDSYLDNSDGTGLPIAIRNLALRGNGDPATSGIVLRSWMSTVDNLYITGFGRDGIQLTNPSQDGTDLTTTQVNGRIVGCMIEDSGRHGIFVRDPEPGNANTDWQALDNYIAGAGGDGIRLENAAGWMIARNHLYGVERNSIYAERLWGTSITDNYVEDFGRSKRPGTYYGVFGSLQGDDSASTIANNRVFEFGGAPNPKSTYVFVGLTGNYGTGAVSVTGNAIRGPMPTNPNTTGLSFSKGEADSVRVTSTGNLVDNVRTARLVGEGVKVDAGR